MCEVVCYAVPKSEAFFVLLCITCVIMWSNWLRSAKESAGQLLSAANSVIQEVAKRVGLKR